MATTEDKGLGTRVESTNSSQYGKEVLSANQRTENDAIIDAVSEMAYMHVAAEQGEHKVPLLVTHKNAQVHHIYDRVHEFLEKQRDKPKRRTGVVGLQDVPSFIELTNRFKSADSAVFCSENTVTTVFNYTPAGSEGTDWCDFKARVHIPVSKEFAAWKNLCSQEVDQKALSTFIDDRFVDCVSLDEAIKHDKTLSKHKELNIVFADQGRLVDISRGLKLTINFNVKNEYIGKNGATSFVFEEIHKTDGKTAEASIPDAFMICIPIIEDGPNYMLMVKIRYRVVEGKIRWRLVIQDLEKAFKEAIKETCESIKTATKLPLFYGSP